MKRVLIFSCIVVSLLISSCSEDFRVPPEGENNILSIEFEMSIQDDNGVQLLANLDKFDPRIYIKTGFCWSTDSIPEVSDSSVAIVANEGQIKLDIENVSSSTQYYFRTYAVAYDITHYSNILHTGMLQRKPEINTEVVSQITDRTAVCGGNIFNTGNLDILVRGVCWSKDENPSTDDKCSIDGSGGGVFTSTLDGLSPNTTYYVRAYAINSAGTGYGKSQVFTTTRPDITGQSGSLSDVDGNIYRWIGIGGQAWMTENLKATHNRNGNEIPLVTSESAWAGLNDNNSDAAYCFYDNNESNSNGALYSYAAARNVCPSGWHLPDTSEWNELTLFLANNGYEGIEGTALKETEGWQDDGNGTDNYGFSGLPGGFRYHFNGNFLNSTSYAFWWSTAEHSESAAYMFIVAGQNESVKINNSQKSSGFSVRCVRDN